MPTSDGMMYNLLSFLHLFEVQNMIEECEFCVVQHDPVLDTNDEEIVILVTVQFRQYDVFELFDRALSRLVDESLLSALFREVIKTRFSHYKNFKELPGQICFMMILDACNTSAAIDIEGAEKHFKSLTFSNFLEKCVRSSYRCIKTDQNHVWSLCTPF